ncbi:chemotaxis protein CheX [Virgibacillus halodenitrificans]|uniref:Chemotaxis protein CheX n=1 Tax=Virgibacillus halodenitrificans TaxID=1482 RepID=A0ABR7VTG8_VIRHA|nr:chemotaxis protein CheX [Virgibacillus halodenitrificans]MBD1224570.1 chemotaxis protein CheX [Virgibacillus halodenitrificans]MCG1026797.1 chemotaxis protein CheX [Virgibacillus halodenitrificans]MCJ0932874.1 chemotaxis protein CheX [Virgibacillus halodenitrificans]MEC2160580.1 chemotaxis protein CheX [Virgibacillus halodenitrificans]MYL44720.1 chemotaxis protein CheX [Virgibacillus halodenitrificans]
MPITIEERNKTITSLLNGTNKALASIVPMDFSMSKPKLLGKSLHLQFGVLIGITGDIKGKLILAGDQPMFGAIGEKMFGMPLEGEMLASFSGELGNMLAGGIATNIIQDGVKTDITAPTIMQGNTTLTGYEKALHLPVAFMHSGEMDIYLLLD